MSRALVDTHVWLWMHTEPGSLRGEALSMIADAGTEILLSAASAWEIAIKYRLGKLRLPEAPSTYVPDRMRRSATTALAVEHAHALRAGELPDHHRDPFDRILVAQAQMLGTPLVTADRILQEYEVEIIPA
ncbi:type II toxin-antitoxin system VapC family toxin [Occultella glacieicola]|uniref:Type II toxin-antitoxin system VapC family toxin n=1 Tax=Occultella glacieicola TaxID=2518684 RepID=A0ABY2DYC3_9MICO|nr:type II toxin-antitoxin system VapC family toxin [Occultella glacieicola]TDE89479.1 type II toxin-antitoxin system VapC family toxin [Occultella glacieicola]